MSDAAATDTQFSPVSELQKLPSSPKATNRSGSRTTRLKLLPGATEFVVLCNPSADRSIRARSSSDPLPIGDDRPFDARFKQWKLVIHDYFFAATLEKIRTGRLILFVTSKGTFDEVEGGLQELISQQADLLGAIRLPNDSFMKNANIEVTTDIVMLRKRLPSHASPRTPSNDRE